MAATELDSATTLRQTPAAAPETAVAPTDAELLSRYVKQGTQEAFAELVSRHVGMVHATCRRVLGGDVHAAEDAAQTTFLVLLRYAGRLEGSGSLAGWLHRTAELVSRNSRRARFRRDRHERTAGMSADLERASSASPAADWEELQPHLDAALAGLPAPQREALVLRYLEGRSTREIAAGLDCPLSTVDMRVRLGLEKLRRRLARRGVLLPTALLAGLLAERAAEAAPAGLAATILTVCTGAATPSAAVAALELTALQSLFWSQVKAAAVVFAALFFLGGAAGILGWPVVERFTGPLAPAAASGTGERLAAPSIGAPVAVALPSAGPAGSRPPAAVSAAVRAAREALEAAVARARADIARAEQAVAQLRAADRQSALDYPEYLGDRVRWCETTLDNARNRLTEVVDSFVALAERQLAEGREPKALASFRAAAAQAGSASRLAGAVLLHARELLERVAAEGRPK